MRFEGNESISSSRLARITNRPEFEEYSTYLIVDLEDAVTSLYESRGFARVQVKGSDTPADLGRRLVLRIMEGPHFEVARTAMVGNETFADEELRDYVVQAPGFWEKDFHERQVETDGRNLEDFFVSHGFLDAHVASAYTLSASAGVAEITHTIAEGARYPLVDVAFSGNRVYSASELRAITQLEMGAWYYPTAARGARARLLDHYRDGGYPNAAVEVSVEVDREEHTIRSEFGIAEGEKVFIADVIVEGNEKTKDSVVLREVTFDSGQPYSRRALYETRRSIYNLGLFSGVSVEPAGPLAEGATTDILIRLEEAKNRRLRLGVGYNSEDGYLASVETSHNNLFGLAHEVGILADLSDISDEERLYYLVPRVFETRYDALAEIFRRRKEEPSFTVERRGFATEMRRSFGPYWRFTPRYSVEDVSLSEVEISPTVTDFRDSEGLLSKVGFLLQRDTRNSLLEPTEGMLTTLEVDVGSDIIGSEFDFLQMELGNTFHLPLTRRSGFVVFLRGGWLQPYGQSEESPLGERYLAGGYGTLRGFPRNEVGPRDENGDFIGGDALLLVNLEYRFPLYKKLMGAVFMDTGNVWREFSDVDLGDTRESAGMGLRYVFPVGALHLDYGHVLDRRSGEDSGRFHFGVGYSF